MRLSIFVFTLFGVLGSLFGQADLSLQLSLSDTTYNVGTSVPLVIHIFNNSSVAATNVVVKCPLPAGLSLINPVAGYNPTTGLWTAGTAGEMSEKTIVLNCIATSGGVKSVFGQIQSCSTLDPDSQPGNNTTNIPVQDDEAKVTFTSAQVDMSLSLGMLNNGPTAVSINDTIVFLVTLQNSGTIGLNTKVRCILPANMAFINATTASGEYSTQFNVWIVGTVNTGSTHTCQIKAKVISAGPTTYIAEVRTVNEPDFDSTPSNFVTGEDDQAELTITTIGQDNGFSNADLSLTHTVTPTVGVVGNLFVYEFLLYNAGNASAQNIVTNYTVPSNLTISSVVPSIGTYVNGVWTVPLINSGTKARIRFSGVLGPFSTPLAIFGQVMSATQADTDSPHGNNNTFDPVEEDETLAVILPSVTDTLGNGGKTDLSVQLWANPDPIVQYDSVKVTFKVLNGSSVTATGVEADLNIPAGFSFINSAASQGNFNTWTGNWLVGTIPANGSATAEVTLYVTTLATSTFYGYVVNQNQTDFDSWPGNNQTPPSFEDDEVEMTFDTSTPPAQACDLALSIAANKTKASVGDTITYTATLNNFFGDTMAYNNNICFVIPSALSIISASGTGTWASGSYWHPGNLAVGGSVSLTLKAKVLSVSAGYRLYGQVFSESPIDKDSAPNNGNGTTAIEDDEAHLVVPISPKQCDLALVMTANKTIASVGDTITYTLALNNISGDTSTYAMQVGVSLPTTLSVLSTTGGTGWISGTKTWLISSLNVGATSYLTIKAKVLSYNTSYNVYAQVKVASPLDKDSAPSNGNGVTVLEDDEALVSINTGPLRCDLGLTVSCNQTTYHVGDTLTMVYTLNNTNGDTSAFGTKVKIVVPAGVSILSYSGGVFSTINTLWTSSTILVSTPKILTIKYLVTETSTSKRFFAQVWLCSNADKDSYPGNRKNTVPIEDDEVLKVLSPALVLSSYPDQNLLADVYPNPTKGYLVIPMQGATSWELVTELGVKTTVDYFEGDQLIWVNTSGLTSGSYFLIRIDQHGKKQVEQVLILH
jgi:large repetitive protein